MILTFPCIRFLWQFEKYMHGQESKKGVKKHNSNTSSESPSTPESDKVRNVCCRSNHEVNTIDLNAGE